jgi:predicted nucleic acid-binding protein
LVSAFIAAGPPSRIMEEVIEGRLQLVLPEAVLVELGRILTQKLGFDADRRQAVHDLLADIAVETIPLQQQPAEPVTGDPDDDIILACAVAAGVEILVSGDRRHMLPVGSHRGVRIITPQALLAELRRT